MLISNMNHAFCHALFGYLAITALLVTIPKEVAGQEIMQVFLEEEQNGGTLVTDIINEARLSERYPDVNELQQLQFHILPSNTELALQYFSIPPNSSTIVTKEKIDRDSICIYRDTCDIPLDIGLHVQPNFQVLKFVVRVTDINDNPPVFPNERISLSIRETAQPGSSFDLPSAEDIDSGNNSIQFYELLNFQDVFELDITETPEGTHRISLVLKSELDRENRESYSLSINARDGGSPPKTGSVVVEVTVLDTNDNNPEFDNELYEALIFENIDIGSTVIEVQAEDLDEGESGEIEYEFSRQSQALYGDLFQINALTGEITTKGVIDYEQNHEFRLQVVAKDKGESGLAGYSQVVITVRDLNDNAPMIAVNTLTSSEQPQVLENRDPGEFVAHIAVSDPDGGSNGEITCSIDNRNFNLEDIYPTEFKITSAARFDREILSDYTIVMTCQDRGNSPQFSTKRIEVAVIDENDHDPHFSRDTYEIRLLENSGVGISVLQVNATDDDIGTNAALTFSLQSIGLYGNDVLQIDPQSGIITTRVSLDYELQTQYSYYVTARDNGTPPKSATSNLVLTILDTNDEAPVFSQPHFSLSIRENSPYNTLVGRVMAYDLDSAPYNQIAYSFASHGWDGHFSIDADTGEIRVTTILDREQMFTHQSYDLIVMASNPGYNLQSSVEVTIFVEDVNDNAPVISFPTSTNNTFSVKSSAERNDLIMKVEAHDIDIGRNGLLSYNILRYHNNHDLFSIDQHTGRIFVAKDLSDYGNKDVELEVEVSDNADDPYSARISLTIFINRTSSSSQKRLLTNLTFVIAVVITSVVLVAIAVVIFIIFMMRRNKQLKKTTVYSCTYQAQDNPGGDFKDGSTEDERIVGANTVSATIPTKNPEPCWPDVLDVNQIGFHEKPGSDRQPTGHGNNYTNISPSKRVHFQDSLDNIQGTSSDAKASGRTSSSTASSSRGGFLESTAAPGQSSGAAKHPPVYLDEGRHKLLYGADARSLLTSHNLQALYRAPEGDELSDQGSSVDSGRGPSEEDSDPNRSSAGINNQSLNDSRESGESNKQNNGKNNYIDMNKARRHLQNAHKNIPHGASQKRGVNSTKGDGAAKVKNPQRLLSDSSHSSQNSSIAPVIPPRGMKPPIHPRSVVNRPLTAHSYPDLNVPNPEQPQVSVPNTITHPADINNTSIGKYNVRTASHDSFRSQTVPESSQRCSHNVIDHFPELCNRKTSPWMRDYIEQDSRSEGGSTTSGSYMVDGAPDHIDLGPEISRDVFV